MIFVFHLTTPASTPQSQAIRTPLPLIGGTITGMEVQFPPGCNALAHIQILSGVYQLFPSNQDSDFATGGETIAWDEDIVLNAEPHQLTAVTWNEDSQYPHTLSVRIKMTPAGGQQDIGQAVQQLYQQQNNLTSGS